MADEKSPDAATRVLVVDDDAVFLSTVARALSRAGLEVLRASSVSEALTTLAQNRDVSVMLTDLYLGDDNGLDLLSSSRQVAPGVSSVLMSGMAMASDVKAAKEQHAVDVLCKPFSEGELVSTVKRAAEATTGFSGSVHGLDLKELLRLLHAAKRTVTVAIDRGGEERGAVHLEAGELIHAEAPGAVGREALSALLRRRKGVIESLPLEAPSQRSLEGSFEELLRDAR